MKYIQKALTTAALATLITGAAFAGERRDGAREKDFLVIPGTYSMDVDSGRLCGQESRITLDPRLSRYNMEFGAGDSECDVQWRQVNDKTRRLEVRNGARIRYGSTIEELENGEFSSYVDGSNDEATGLPKLKPGTIIEVVTGAGNHRLAVRGYVGL